MSAHPLVRSASVSLPSAAAADLHCMGGASLGLLVRCVCGGPELSGWHSGPSLWRSRDRTVSDPAIRWVLVSLSSSFSLWFFEELEKGSKHWRTRGPSQHQRLTFFSDVNGRNYFKYAKTNKQAKKNLNKIRQEMSVKIDTRLFLGQNQSVLTMFEW